LLAGHLDGDILVGDVAAACGMSRSSFMRGFRETTGTTPMQWLTRLRIETAKKLLGDSELSLAEIGARCGFADQSHFTRVFSARTGVSPGAWRRGA
jgi:AraC-like DNA-binding protein